MIREITTLLLTIAIFASLSGISINAQSGAAIGLANGAEETTKTDNKAQPIDSAAGDQLRKEFLKEFSAKQGNNISGREKSTQAEYEKQKAAGKKFSTTTKILIGAGIAAAVVGVVVFAASRDKIRTF